MNDEEILFNIDEDMGSYYDFNLLDLLEDNDASTEDMELDSIKRM